MSDEISVEDFTLFSEISILKGRQLRVETKSYAFLNNKLSNCWEKITPSLCHVKVIVCVTIHIKFVPF